MGKNGREVQNDNRNSDDQRGYRNRHLRTFLGFKYRAEKSVYHHADGTATSIQKNIVDVAGAQSEDILYRLNGNRRHQNDQDAFPERFALPYCLQEQAERDKDHHIAQNIANCERTAQMVAPTRVFPNHLERHKIVAARYFAVGIENNVVSKEQISHHEDVKGDHNIEQYIHDSPEHGTTLAFIRQLLADKFNQAAVRNVVQKAAERFRTALRNTNNAGTRQRVSSCCGTNY